MDANYRSVPSDVFVDATLRVSEAGKVDHPDNDSGRTVELTQYQLQQALAVAYERGMQDQHRKTFTKVELGVEPILQAGEDLVARRNEIAMDVHEWVERHPAYQVVGRRVTRWAPEYADTPTVDEPSRHVRFDGMTWPDPRDPAEVEWTLRYGRPTRGDLLTAASFIAAYKQLVYDNQTVRNGKVRALRAASAQARQAQS